MEYTLLATSYYNVNNSETFYSLHNGIEDALEEARECLTGRDGVRDKDIPAYLEDLKNDEELTLTGLLLEIKTVNAPEPQKKEGELRMQKMLTALAMYLRSEDRTEESDKAMADAADKLLKDVGGCHSEITKVEALKR